MGRDADLAEPLEQILGNAVVEDALALDLVALLVVKGGGVVLEMLNERAGFWPLVQDLGLAFVDAPAAVHIGVLIAMALTADSAKARALKVAAQLVDCHCRIDLKGLGPT